MTGTRHWRPWHPIAVKRCNWARRAVSRFSRRRFSAGDEIKGHGRGYITSVTWSTELNKFIALGLYQGGLKHEGEDIICAFPLKNEQVKARIVSPHFIDKEGARLNA